MLDYYGCCEVEVWKEIEGYEAYEVSNLGAIRTRIKLRKHQPALIVPRDSPYRRIIKQTPKEKGHLMVQLWKLDENGQYKKPKHARTVHQLVAAAFLGPRPPGTVCRHWDGNPKNNKADNLLYGTHKENEQDKKRHGTYQYGENNPSAKLTAETIHEIDRLYRNGISKEEIAFRFGVQPKHVTRIIRRERWGHLPIAAN